jgi:hypothetical protein
MTPTHSVRYSFQRGSFLDFALNSHERSVHQGCRPRRFCDVAGWWSTGQRTFVRFVSTIQFTVVVATALLSLGDVSLAIGLKESGIHKVQYMRQYI